RRAAGSSVSPDSESRRRRNHGPPTSGIPNRKKTRMHTRLSCKIDYLLRSNHRDRSIASEFFTDDKMATWILPSRATGLESSGSFATRGKGGGPGHWICRRPFVSNGWSKRRKRRANPTISEYMTRPKTLRPTCGQPRPRNGASHGPHARERQR